MESKTPKQIYNKLSSVYDRSYNEPIHRIEDDYIYKFLNDNGLTKGRILDLGCGTGTLLENVIVSPENYVGLDISEKMLGISSQKFPNHRFVRGTMSKLPFDDNSFDSVVSLFGSFSYSLNLQKTVQEIIRVLKPDGKCFIMAYGEKYQKRETYLLNRLNIQSPATFFSVSVLNEIFRDFGEVKITGMTTNLSENLSNQLPYPLAKTFHGIETKLFGQIIPDKFYFINIMGQKHA